MAGGAIAHNLIQLNIARVAVLAVRKKKKGAWIIACGALSFLVFFILFMLQGSFTNHSFFSLVSPLRVATHLLAFLSIPTATSIYLGLEFAFINGALKQKLVEVEALSQKTTAQEKEKQQMLYSQNETLEKQATKRTAELKQSLENLKSTQAQLIQSEKMASLGELTAGIAHEIQNPLKL